MARIWTERLEEAQRSPHHVDKSCMLQGSPFEALRSLWRGVGATLAKDVPFAALFWMLLEPLRQTLRPDGFLPLHRLWPASSESTAGTGHPPGDIFFLTLTPTPLPLGVGGGGVPPVNTPASGCLLSVSWQALAQHALCAAHI